MNKTMRKLKACCVVMFALGIASARGQTASGGLTRIDLKSLTNVFLTVDDFEFAAKGMEQASIDRSKLALALSSNETRPEEGDPEGNWGDAKEGLRLSLRFEKPDYVAGEWILATILIRNVSHQELEYTRLGTDWDFPLTVYGPDNRKLEDIRPDEPGTMGHIGFVIYPGTQKRIRLRLDPHFKFDSPGEYSISVRTRVNKIQGQGTSEISSGMARIKIVPRPAGAPDSPIETPK